MKPEANENLLVFLGAMAEMTNSIRELSNEMHELSEQVFILNQMQLNSMQENNLRNEGIEFLAGLVSNVWKKKGKR